MISGWFKKIRFTGSSQNFGLTVGISGDPCPIVHCEDLVREKLGKATDLEEEYFLMAGLADESAEKRRCLRAGLLTRLSKCKVASG